MLNDWETNQTKLYEAQTKTTICCEPPKQDNTFLFIFVGFDDNVFQTEHMKHSNNKKEVFRLNVILNYQDTAKVKTKLPLVYDSAEVCN